LDDEVLLKIMSKLLKIRVPREQVLRLHRALTSGASDLASFTLVCRRFDAILRSSGHKLRLEMVARSASQVIPLNLQTKNPFTMQLFAEKRSSVQLNLLRKAASAASLHCASACCAASRKALNRDSRKSYKGGGIPPQLLPCAEHCYALAVCEKEAFLAFSKRSPKRELHGADRSPRLPQKWLAHLRLEQTGDRLNCHEIASLCLREEGLGAPHLIATDGIRCALIRQFEIRAFETQSAVHIWKAGGLQRLQPPSSFVDHGLINAQNVWFCGGAIVVWSTQYVCPRNETFKSSAPCSAYGFAIYNEDGELYVTIGKWSGMLNFFAPAQHEAVAIVRPSDLVGPGSECLWLHKARSERRFFVEMQRATPRTRAARISPSAHCLVAVRESREQGVLVEVMLRNGTKSFLSWCVVDASHFFVDSCVPGAFRFSVSFSPCSRFAICECFVFGKSSVLVVFDVSCCHRERGVRALPICFNDAEDVSPRGVVWAESGIWVKARHGALFLHTPAE
jgi:hypothetical protein